MTRLLAVLLVSIAVLPGCGKKPKVASADKVTYVADDDPRMNAAIEKARGTVNQFIVALKAPKPGQGAFSVKMAFSDGKNTEHMWLGNVSFDGQKFQGEINNDPEQVKGFRIGQKASIEPTKISDWMYVENKKLVGGFTLRALRDAMSPSERAEFDKSVPFAIN